MFLHIFGLIKRGKLHLKWKRQNVNKTRRKFRVTKWEFLVFIWRRQAPTCKSCRVTILLRLTLPSKTFALNFQLSTSNLIYWKLQSHHIAAISPVFENIHTQSQLLRVCFGSIIKITVQSRIIWNYKCLDFYSRRNEALNDLTHWAWVGLLSFPIYFPIWSQYWFRRTRTPPCYCYHCAFHAKNMRKSPLLLFSI